MKWKEKQVSLFTSHYGGGGRGRSLRQILFSDFGDNIGDIVKLRSLDIYAPDYQVKKDAIKAKLKAFAPAALLTDRNKVEKTDPDYKKKMDAKIIERSGLVQIDFDYKDIKDYDIEELKQATFALPFVAFASLSCSGNGFYVLVAIAEPERQSEYAEHLFNVFTDYGIKPDTGKGRNANDLRYVSYDANMLDRDEVEPLRITHFKPKTAPKKQSNTTARQTNFNGNHGALIHSQVQKILSAQVGQRWGLVQSAAATLGGRVWRGLNEVEGLQSLIQAIEHNTAFAGQTDKYIECAKVCFERGKADPMPDKLN